MGVWIRTGSAAAVVAVGFVAQAMAFSKDAVQPVAYSTDSAIAWSPDGKSLAFTADQGMGGPSLFKIGRSGGSAIGVFGPSAAVNAIVWAPSQTPIAVANFTLLRLPRGLPVSARSHPLTGGVEPAVDRRGDRLAFATGPGAGCADRVGVVEIASGKVHYIATAGEAQRPQLSPDGTQIAYLASAKRPSSTSCTVNALRVSSTGVGVSRTLASLPHVAFGPFAWMQSGSGVLIGYEGKLLLVGLNRSTQALWRGFWDGDSDPRSTAVVAGAVSPDERRVAFVTCPSILRDVACTLRVASTRPRRATAIVTSLQLRGNSGRQIAWSPDGSRIAFLASSKSDTSRNPCVSLYTVTPSGVGLRRLTPC